MGRVAVIGLVGVSAGLAACVAIVGPCELTREPISWRLKCEGAGSAVVAPPSTLQTIVAASGAKP